MLAVSLAAVALLSVGLFGTLAALVYRDARRTGVRGPGKWAAFVFLSGGTGFLLYLAESDDGADDADPRSLPRSTASDARSSSGNPDRSE